MNVSKLITLIFLVLYLSSCKTSPQAPISSEPSIQQVQIPPERAYLRGFSFIPLNENGWDISQVTTYNEIALSKDGQHPGETYVINGKPFGTPTINNQDDFNSFFQSSSMNNLDPSRYKILHQSIETYTAKRVYCATLRGIVEDHQAVQSSGTTALMIMESISLGCLHPLNDKVSIYLSFSHRHYPGNVDPNFTVKADSLFETIEFELLDNESEMEFVNALELYNEQEYEEAFNIFSSFAKIGYARAQYFLGTMYNDGKGVPKDAKKATMWNKKAAEQGFAEAQFILGLKYFIGEGVNVDYRLAFEWFKKSAEQGHAEAQEYVGTMYYRGLGVQQNPQKGYKWTRKAIERGSGEAQKTLNSICRNHPQVCK